MAIGLSGCAIPVGPYDYTYSAYGGRWQRTDSTSGRVGSLFSNAGARVSDDASAPDSAAEKDLYPDIQPAMSAPQ